MEIAGKQARFLLLRGRWKVLKRLLKELTRSDCSLLRLTLGEPHQVFQPAEECYVDGAL